MSPRSRHLTFLRDSLSSTSIYYISNLSTHVNAHMTDVLHIKCTNVLEEKTKNNAHLGLPGQTIPTQLFLPFSFSVLVVTGTVQVVYPHVWLCSSRRRLGHRCWERWLDPPSSLNSWVACPKPSWQPRPRGSSQVSQAPQPPAPHTHTHVCLKKSVCTSNKPPWLQATNNSNWE